MTLKWKILQWKINIIWWRKTWPGFSPSFNKVPRQILTPAVCTAGGHSTKGLSRPLAHLSILIRYDIFCYKYLSLILQGCPSYRRSLQTLKRERSALQHYTFLSFFSFLFHPPRSGSGSSRTKYQCSRSMRIRVLNTALYAECTSLLASTPHHS
jgi:hypothetical protein